MNDIPQYYFVDTGCSRATEYLGKKSKCLDCPFPDCIQKENDHPPSNKSGKDRRVSYGIR